MVVHTAIEWGWRDPLLTVSERHRIANAACHQVGYDFGYPRPLASSQMPVWFAKIHQSIATGDTGDPLSPSTANRASYVSEIEDAHPGYMLELFRYAQNVLGTMATFSELADCMNKKSAAPGEPRPTLSLNRKQVGRWFKQHGGSEKSALEKPLLTTEHKRNRCKWAVDNWELLTQPGAPVAFLDEKWFYTTSRRKQMKQLPQQQAEEADVVYRRPKVVSRRFPVKVMFLGVVACPNPTHKFDGRVFLKRVSKEVEVTRASRNKNFSVDAVINDGLKAGCWKDLLIGVADITVQEAVELVGMNYDLDDFVTSRLQLSYDTFTVGGKKKRKKLEPGQRLDTLGVRTLENGEQVAIGLQDLELDVVLQAGDLVEQDCSCDSDFMLETMPMVGQSLREKFHWVDLADPIYLVMDNAGGHGTIEAKEHYIEALRAFNVIVIWQVPRSPETNILDLGVWMSIQTSVQRVHRGRRCQHSALAKSVEDAWESYLNEKAFMNVWRRLRVVLRCILDDKGGNQTVESKRGALFRDATIVDLTMDEDTIPGVQERVEMVPDVISIDDDDEEDIISVSSL